MSMWEAAAMAAGGLLVAALLAYAAWRLARRLRRLLLSKIAHEAAVGHRGVRRRVQGLVGRRQDTFETVMEAETMRGYVWFYWTRRAREGYRERTGWAPTRRLARRQLQHVMARDTPSAGSPRR